MTPTKKGELYALLLSVLESWFPIWTLFILKSIGALFAYSLSIMVATVAFIGLIGFRKSWSEFSRKEAWPDLLWTTFYITTLFILVVVGLKYTTASNMSVIITLQLFFSYLYFNVFGHEIMNTRQTLGAFLMGIGTIIILYPEDFSPNLGDLLILLSSMVAPVANVYQKRARTHVSSHTILAFRNIVALPFLLMGAFYFETAPSIEAIGNVWGFILLNGLLIFTFSKILWIEALNLISITKLSAMISFIPIFTLIFAYFTLGEEPTMRQMIGIIPVFLGGFLITQKRQNRS